MSSRWSQEEVDILLRNSHLSSKDLLQLLPNRTTVQIKQKSNIFSLNLPKSKKLQENNINHSFFKQDNYIVNYWKGFIAADGCVYCRKNGGSKFLAFGLHMQDVDHLEKFKIVTNSSHPISIRRELYRYLTIGSKEIYEDLVKCGICDRKSNILDEVIFNKDFSNHFIRGYFDGDGCLYFNETINQRQLSMVGTENFLNRIEPFFPARPHIVFERKGKTVFRLRFTKLLDIYDVLNWMYKDSCDLSRLTRKYNKYHLYLKSKFTICN